MLRVAKTDSKQVLEFEGIEQQFELYEQAPWATQISFLEEALKAVETRGARRELNRIVQAWETADRGIARALAGRDACAIVGGLAVYGGYDPAGRHPQMVRKIETMMADGKAYLFAVGALHLVGPQGLVEMLRARGYTLIEL